jgi:hemolysin activation/secretion protein
LRVASRWTNFRLAACVIAPGILSLGNAAFAQSLSDIDRQAQRLQEQQQQQARDRAEQFDRSRERPPSGEEIMREDQPPAVNSQCAAIDDVRLVGVTHYEPDTFATALASLKSSCVGLGAIDGVLRVITNRYVHDGYVTSRALVGPQDLKTGVLTITVIEGRVGVIKGTGNKPYGPGELAAVFPRMGNRLLNLRALEQGVDQLARMAKADPGIDIAPGGTAGTSDVMVTRKPLSARLRPSLTFTSDGPASTGRWQGTATIDADSPLGIADVWSFYYQHDVNGDGTRGSEAYGGFVSIPHDWWTLSLSAGASDYHSVLSGNDLSFTNAGKSWNASASLDRMLHRDARSKLSMSGGLSLVDTENEIAGIQLRTSSYRIVSLKLGTRWQRRVGKAVLVSASISYERGLGMFGANAADFGPGGPSGKFDLVSGDVAVQSGFTLAGTRFTNFALVRWQLGFDNLFPAQRLSLGGSSTIRGFQDDGISGRSGASLREQLGFGIANLARTSRNWGTAVSGYVGYDVGGILPNGYDAYERGLMQSASFGLRMQNRHVQAEVSLAVPISAPNWIRKRGAVVSGNMRISL